MILVSVVGARYLVLVAPGRRGGVFILKRRHLLEKGSNRIFGLQWGGGFGDERIEYENKDV